MTRVSLRLRLMVAGAVAVTAALGLAAAGLAALFSTHVERRAAAELTVQLDQVLASLVREGDVLALAVPPADPRFEKPYGGLYWQIESSGRLLRSRSLWDYVLPLPSDALARGETHAHELAGPAGETLLALERSVTLPARLGNVAARAVVAVDKAGLDAAKRAFLVDMAPYLLLLGTALVAAGWLQITVGLRPLRDLGARVAALRAGHATRLENGFPKEVQPLASELDGLLAAREADIERARARAGDLAHGLKTPLQALLGEAGRLRARGLAEVAGGIEEIARTMQRHVDRELARARLAGRARHAGSDLAGVARRIVAVLRRTPEGARLAWQVAVADGLRAAIDPADLSEALGALAENAARHARGLVRLEAARLADRLELTVRDDGPGIPPDRLVEMTARGTRLDAGGTGLGLAIAREIAEAAGGGLVLENGHPGLAARLVLPAA